MNGKDPRESTNSPVTPQNTHNSRKRRGISSTIRSKLRRDCCCICLEVMINEATSINSCNHIFHWECIEHWSAINNRCPLCKIKFNLLKALNNTHTHSDSKNTNNESKDSKDSNYKNESGYENGKRYKEVKDTEPIESETGIWENFVEGYQFEDRPDSLSAIMCRMCHCDQDPGVLLLCELCNAGYHTYCIGLSAVPSGDFYCMYCSVTTDESEGECENGNEKKESSKIRKWKDEEYKCHIKRDSKAKRRVSPYMTRNRRQKLERLTQRLMSQRQNREDRIHALRRRHQRDKDKHRSASRGRGKDESCEKSERDETESEKHENKNILTSSLLDLPTNTNTKQRRRYKQKSRHSERSTKRSGSGSSLMQLFSL